MAEESSLAVRDIEVLFRGGAVGRLSDAELVRRFATRRDGGAAAAFSALVERHGPMVLGVCRRILRDPYDVEDAFQATFLILAKKAGSVKVGDSLGRWLYGVCRRVAVRAKVNVARRAAREVRGSEAATVPAADPIRLELLAAIDDEVARLPERHRAVVVLCDLGGLTHEAAARQLGCPVGTVESRLARSRERLRVRLARRGLAPSAALTAAILGPEAARAGVPAALLDATIRAAKWCAAGKMASGVVSASVAALTEGGLRMLLWTKWRFTVVAGLTAGIAAVGVGLFAQPEAGNQPRTTSAVGQPEEDDAAKRRVSVTNLKKISLALVNYLDNYNHLPPAAITDQDGTPLLSWRVAILPFLVVRDDKSGQRYGEDLYKQFRLDEPWDSPHNKALLARMPETYAPPGGAKEPYATHYRAFVGKGTAFEEGRRTSYADVTDGMGTTLMVVEAGEPVPWTKPEELPYAPGEPLPKLGGIFPDGFTASFMNGLVRFIRKEIDENTLRALITRNGGEQVSLEQVPQRSSDTTRGR